MQFTTIIAVLFASMAYAAPVEDNSGVVEITLPDGCTDGDLAKCALHLVGTTASCGAAVIELGANPAADLACVGSAAGTAANFDECKNCIPKSTKVVAK
ncbi:hypothetical protein K431DRAFT_299785 [Polychaeton citri CBS 116435]|uniref:Fungal calcium binding protein domain-containing protein n=1 Tax=Polychaeton citri CBS 116435 TaxID=1314669 RepID=A0A9P4QH29_9PEZI|nr:hypothetical protein K431DRAFT_299785 [Polychaeton citri CBS 116435]